MYDYGARNYDPAIGRWMNIDPLIEKYSEYSTYNYSLNNPVKYIDKDGLEPKDSGDPPINGVQLNFTKASTPVGDYSIRFNFFDHDNLSNKDQLFQSETILQSRFVNLGESKDDNWQIPTRISVANDRFENGVISTNVDLQISRDNVGKVSVDGTITITIAGDTSSVTKRMTLEGGAEGKINGIGVSGSAGLNYSETVNINGATKQLIYKFNAIYKGKK